MSKDNFLKSYYKELEYSPSGDSFLLNDDGIPKHRLSILKCFDKEVLRITLTDLDMILSQMESPIEELFGGALIIAGIENAGEIKVYADYGHFQFGHGPDSIVIWPQHQIGEYRIDFYIEYWDGYYRSMYGNDYLSKLVVECDGHDFHEKTKEQAQKDKEKDRILQSCGYPVFRFTGSEIWKSPFKCANIVMDFLEKQMKEMKKPE